MITVVPIADTTISVSWVPSNNPITEYQFIYDPPISAGDSSSSIPISNNPMKRLDGLTPGQNYKLIVNTVDAAGTITPYAKESFRLSECTVELRVCLYHYCDYYNTMSQPTRCFAVATP